MRLIFIGCEYVGKTTLANALEEWGICRGRRFHMDDSDFSIPDDRHLNEAEQQAMVKLPPTLKERFQRFQVYYHLDILARYDDCILGGFHIQEAIYGPRYYYPGRTVNYHHSIESQMPDDTILVLMTATPQSIMERMEIDPHRYPLVKADEVEEILTEFEVEFAASSIRQKVTFDTSEFESDQVLVRFLDAVRPQLSLRELILIS